MKTLRMVGASLLALAAVLTLGVLSAAAQGPTGVAFLDNQTHTVAANGSTLYQFTYSLNDDGSRPVINITMPNGTNNGLGFQIWTADTVNDMADFKPVGQGTAANVDCSTGEVSGSGGCTSPDLTWQGSFGAPGTYYVLVTNGNNAQASYALKIQGSGVGLGQQLQASAPGAPSAPAAAPAANATANTDDPTKAAAIDASQHTLTGNGVTWYSFNYGLNDDGTRPVVTITMPNGNANGLSFQVWSADAFQGGWFNNKPVGIGTAAATDCSTGEVAGGGGCASPDLTWQGAFGAPGTYYVRVINGNNAPANYTLSIQ